MFSISTSSANMKDIFAWQRIYGFVLLAWLLSTGKWPSPLLPHSVTGPTLATFSLSGRPSLLTSLLSMHLRPGMHFCFSYIGSPKTAFQYLDYEGARQFSPFQRAWSDCVGDDLPPNQRCRGSRLTQCGLTAHMHTQITNTELHAPPDTEDLGRYHLQAKRKPGNNWFLIQNFCNLNGKEEIFILSTLPFCELLPSHEGNLSHSKGGLRIFQYGRSIAETQWSL